MLDSTKYDFEVCVENMRDQTVNVIEALLTKNENVVAMKSSSQKRNRRTT